MRVNSFLPGKAGRKEVEARGQASINRSAAHRLKKKTWMLVGQINKTIPSVQINLGKLTRVLEWGRNTKAV